MLGFKRKIVHPNGKTYLIERKGVTDYHKKYFIENLGMPDINMNDDFGNLFLVIDYKIPNELLPKDKRLISELSILREKVEESEGEEHIYCEEFIESIYSDDDGEAEAQGVQCATQ